MTEPLRPLDFDDDSEIDPYMAHRQLREAVVIKIRNLSYDELVRLNDVLDTPGFLAPPATAAELPDREERLVELADFAAALDRLREAEQRRGLTGQPYNGDLEEMARRYGQQRSQFNPGSASVWFNPNTRPPENPSSLILPSNSTKVGAVTTRQALERVFRHVTGIDFSAAERAVAARYQYADNPVAAANAITQEDIRALQAASAAGTPAPVPAGGMLAFAALPAEHLPVDRTPRQPVMWSSEDGAYISMRGDRVIGERADRVRGEIPEPMAGMLGLDPDSFEPDPPSDEEAEAHAASLEAAAETTEPRRGWTEFVVAEHARQAGRIIIPEDGRWNGPVGYRSDGIGYAVLDNRRALGANFD